MNTFIVKNVDRLVGVFKGTKLSDCIFKVGSGTVVWEKHCIFHTPKSKECNYVYLKGVKQGHKDKYTYTMHRVRSMQEIVNLVKQDKVEHQAILGFMVRSAFNILHAGAKPIEIKDRKYRLEKKLKQIALPLPVEQNKSSKICYKYVM